MFDSRETTHPEVDTKNELYLSEGRTIAVVIQSGGSHKNNQVHVGRVSFMGQSDDSGLTPEDRSFEHLPEQTMYKVQTPEAHGADSTALRHSPLIIRTNEFRLLFFELEPSGQIDWHTHVPGLDEVNLCLEGSARYTLEREDGSHQTIEIHPMEFVYVPGGARHKIEAIGEQPHRSLSAAKFDAVARLEDLENVPETEETHADGPEWQDALFVDRKRDEVVAKDDNLVSK